MSIKTLSCVQPDSNTDSQTSGSIIIGNSPFMVTPIKRNSSVSITLSQNTVSSVRTKKRRGLSGPRLFFADY
jgi:hypothetical protein